MLCSAQEADTLSLARDLQSQGEYDQAIELLKTYERNNPDNIYSKRLHAVLLYWVSDIKEASALYEILIKQYPEVIVLNLEYGRMLFEIGEYKEATEYLSKYLEVIPDDVEARLKLGWINYYHGDFKIALQYADQVLNQYPRNVDGIALYNTIKEIYAPILDIRSKYIHDSQPIDLIGATIKSGGYINKFFAPPNRVHSRSI